MALHQYVQVCELKEVLLYTGETYPPCGDVVPSAIISVVQSLILRVVVQWTNLVGYYDLWYNKGCTAGELSIEQGLRNKDTCRLCKIGGVTDNMSSQACPFQNLSGAVS